MAPHTQVVTFKGARGPVSASKSAEIIEGLERKSGDTDILLQRGHEHPGEE